ncbi:MAG: DNA topoisomerase [Clostridia bacterium]|nr:DNA topoisomerase [Clostridia bacterium]
MAKKQQYGNESITLLKGEDRVRKRPAVIFGSDSIEGCEHAAFEIITNAIDEAREGYGKKITVVRYLDKSLEVRDMGRGIPVDWNAKENRYNWELVFCELYAGGKYDSNSGGSYEYALGLNGLGLVSTQYASEYMTAEIKTGGFLYKLSFRKGRPDGEMVKEPYSGRDTGTTIRWRPDPEVFTDIDIPAEYFTESLKRQAVVNDGVTFIFKNEISSGRFETQTFLYTGGIDQYVTEFAGEDALTSVRSFSAERTGRDAEDRPEYKLKMRFAVCFSDKKTLKEYYHNSSPLEYGGSPDAAVKSAFVSAIDKYLKNENKYTKGEGKISFSDVEDSLILVSSSFSTMTSYENQTKKAINNKFIRDAMTDYLKTQLEIWFMENRLDAQKIADRVLINMRSRVRAEATRQATKKTLAAGRSMVDRVEKFVDCRSRDVSEREIFIVEGDSALGACKQARDGSFQAIMPIRGKILNCLKADFHRILASDVIMDLVRVLGCGIELRGRTKGAKGIQEFSLDNLRWRRVIICTDADVDGYQIRTLVLAMIYALMPGLIYEGRVFIAESPLYEITSKDGVWFAYNEQEKADALSQIGDKKRTVQRSKGLGENDADMMWMTTMNPATRRLIKVNPDPDSEEMARMFELLLGDDLQGRKDYIAVNGSKYIDLTDVM